MRFTDRKTLFTDRIPLLSIRSIRRDRHMAFTDRYGAGVLDNPQAILEIPGLGNYLSKSKSGKGFPRNYITSETLVSVIETNNKNVTLKPVLCLDWEVAFLKAEPHRCLSNLNTHSWLLLENFQKMVSTLDYWLRSQVMLC